DNHSTARSHTSQSQSPYYTPTLAANTSTGMATAISENDEDDPASHHHPTQLSFHLTVTFILPSTLFHIRTTLPIIFQFHVITLTVMDTLPTTPTNDQKKTA
ncbi:hypothetical protein H0H93_013146, partial [Arthromyces matolae]